jgi:hypothetical protein
MRASRRVLTFLTSLLAVGMIASAGLAVTKPSMPSPDETATSESDATTCVDEGTPAAEPDDPGEDAAGCGDVEGTDEEGEPSPSEEDDAEGVDAPDGEETDGDALGEDPESGAVDPIREAACSEAAGVTPDPEETEDAMDPAVEKPHGLENAIAHVLQNCADNPQAPGLLVAIRHLVANAAKREMHEEAKADARREKKHPSQRRGPPASRGASGTGGSRGNGGPPGQPSTHGNGNAYGNGNANGSAGSSHGNPHGG